MERHDKTNIFKNAKFGDHYLFDGDDCIFLQKVSDYDDDGSEPLYELARHRHMHYKDGSENDFVVNIRTHSDGFAYCCENEGEEIEMYVTPREKNVFKGLYIGDKVRITKGQWGVFLGYIYGEYRVAIDKSSPETDDYVFMKYNADGTPMNEDIPKGEIDVIGELKNEDF